MPQAAITRIRILFRHWNGNAGCGCEIDRVFARRDRPFAPWRDDLQLRRERLIRELESNLIVSLAGAAVRHGITSGGQRDLDLLSRDERSCCGGAEEVVLLVDRSSLQDGKEIIAR